MTWVSIEKKVIGTVAISERGAPPGPSSPVIQSFIDEHRKLKGILDRYGTKGMCVTRGTLEKEGGIVGERLDKHLDVFHDHHSMEKVDGDILCGRIGLAKLKEKIKLEL